jgi:nitroreductase
MKPKLDVFEAIGTLRAVRRFGDEPVSDEEIWTILEAATMAPSGGNRQPWNFIVIRDPETKRRIGEYYREAWDATYGKLTTPPSGSEPQGLGRAYRSAEHLAHHLAEVPVLIMVTTQGAGFGTSVTGSSIFPAVQNLMLAARALGLGSTITTLHRMHEAEVKKLLEIPDEIETMALIPVGRPRERFGPPRRLPVDQVTFWEKWRVRRNRPSQDGGSGDGAKEK